MRSPLFNCSSSSENYLKTESHSDAKANEIEIVIESISVYIHTSSQNRIANKENKKVSGIPYKRRVFESIWKEKSVLQTDKDFVLYWQTYLLLVRILIVNKKRSQ